MANAAIKQGPGEDIQKTARSVFVGNIPYEATEEQLKEIFQQVGPVSSFRIVYDRETGKPKGYGFCEYQDLETAQSAMRNLNEYDFHGRNLRVGHAAGETSNAEKAVSQLVTGPIEDPLYGTPVEPNKAPEAISKAVASLPPEQMFELMKQMKMCIQNNPNEARNMLLQNPQLAYALLQAQIVMKIVDPQVALAMLHRQSEQIPPLMPTSEEGNKPGGPDSAGGMPSIITQGAQLGAPGSQQSPHMQPPNLLDMDHRRPSQPQNNMGGGAPQPSMAPPMSSMSGGQPPQSMMNSQPQMSMANSNMQGGPGGGNFGGPGGRGPPGPGGPIGGLLGDRPQRPGFDNNRNMQGPGPRGPGGPQGFMDRGHVPMEGQQRFRGPGPNQGGPQMGMGGPGGPGPQGGGFGGPPQGGPPGPGGPMGRADPRDPRSGRMGPGGPPAPPPPMGGPPRQGGPLPGLPAGVNASMLGGPRPGGPPGPGGNITSQDQEKAQLIMQVLQLSDEQIALLPPDQRQSILILKEQIARSTNP